MASPTHPVFPPPPTSWQWPLLPPSSASSEKKERLLFELKFNQVRLLQNALKSLAFTATSPDGGSPLGSFYILADDDVFLVAKTVVSPNVATCLALSRRLAAFDVPAGRVVRLNLRRLEDAMTGTVDDVGEGLTTTLCLKQGEKEEEIVCSLKRGNDDVESSVIPVIPYLGDPEQVGSSYWSKLKNRFVLSFLISVQSLNQVMDLKGSPVHIKVTKKTVKFKVDNSHKTTIQLWKSSKLVGQYYQILRRTPNYPLRMQFTSLHPIRDAILNAAALSDTVIFHMTPNSRCVLEIFLDGVGSIYFCFNKN